MSVLSFASEIAVFIGHFCVLLFLCRALMNAKSRSQNSYFGISHPRLPYYWDCNLSSSGYIYNIIISHRI